jgi:hypothetical protein
MPLPDGEGIMKPRHLLKPQLMILAAGISVIAFGATVTFEPDTSNFPNPERGFAVVNDPPWAPQIKWSFCGCENYDWDEWTEPLEKSNLDNWRRQGWSLVFVRYHLSAFRHSDLSSTFLEGLENDMTTVRSAGFKIVPRFTYNWPRGGPDAPVSTVLRHIGQLKPLIRENTDVIAYLDLGFIGCWGENHSSCFGLVDGGSVPNNNSWAILDSLFSAVPARRTIAVRYPRWKFIYFGNQDEKPIVPLTELEAYGQTIKARWGFHDDCPVCGEWNCGTWQTRQHDADQIIDFLAAENLYVIQSGEPGDPETGGCGGSNDDDGDGWSGAHHADCDRMLWLFSKDRWSVISGQYGEDPDNRAYQIWKSQGCYSTIAKKLGYRFSLLKAHCPDIARAGQTISIALTIQNEGWARPYNPRSVEIVLRNSQSNECHVVPFTPPKDARLWLPGPDDTTELSVEVAVPEECTEGTYEILLNLPDPEESLHDNPLYSIRLANKDIR